MDIVLVEFAAVHKNVAERFILPIHQTCLIGETKTGCCVMASDGCVYDTINDYDDVKKFLADAGIKVVSLPALPEES